MSHHPEAPSNAVPAAQRRALRVLVVDDEIRIAHGLRMVLADEFDTVATTRPEEALAWITSGEPFDVVLCDVMMPVMNGVELRNRVHAVRPELAARFILLTGGVVSAHLRELLASVPNTVVEKPMQMRSLRELIRRTGAAAGAESPDRSGS